MSKISHFNKSLYSTILGSAQTPHVKDTVSRKTVLTSNTSHKFQGSQATVLLAKELTFGAPHYPVRSVP